MWNIGLFTTFHTAASSAICWPSAWAIPPFRNSDLEGSLHFRIPIWRDPSFQKFWKPHLFCRLLAVFCHVFWIFTDNLYVHCHFCKKKLVHLTFSGRESADCKVPPHIGGHHFLLCQQTNTKDIAGQSARDRDSSALTDFPRGGFSCFP